MEAIADRVGIPNDRIASVIEWTGNTSSASIPLALVEAIEQGRLSSGRRGALRRLRCRHDLGLGGLALGTRTRAVPGAWGSFATLRHVAAEQQRVADLLVRCLENEGVTCVFGIPGEENIRFTDALVRSSIRYVLVRHEQAASFMAEIHGRLTGRAGVCSSTLGPGSDQPPSGNGRCQ